MKQGFELTSSGYLKNCGVDVMAFSDIYPEGHQSGVSIIMHGNRAASNGDLRLTGSPGQWAVTADSGQRTEDRAEGAITAHMSFKEPRIDYAVTVKADGASVIVTVDLKNPVPDCFEGKVLFNLELFPGALFGKPWSMDGKHGIFPTQPIAPSGTAMDAPYAVGKRLVIQPGDIHNMLTIETKGRDLVLHDGRLHVNNGWFIVSGEISRDRLQNAIHWVITPSVDENWLHTPVVQASQVGYHPEQKKTAVIELDSRDGKHLRAEIVKITEGGEARVFEADTEYFGKFLRYNYLKFDFSRIKDDGIYKIKYGGSASEIFRIAEDVYERGVWQPVLEYFLPVQMCHMRVMEKSRCWHGFCHDDDAKMAPVNHLHFDGYVQGPSTLTKYKPGEYVPGLNEGGWHDAGDDDLRIESQAGEIYILALAYEEFGVDLDVTAICQESKVTQIHQPDGKNDILQQIEHGLLSVIGAYRSLGRLYRGIITNNLEQYTMMGDPAAQTDNIRGNEDDRWVFTEDNPPRELTTAAQLAAAARVMRGFNDALAARTLEAAQELFDKTEAADDNEGVVLNKLHAAAELYLTTGEALYRDFLVTNSAIIADNAQSAAWFMGRAAKRINDEGLNKAIGATLPYLKALLDEREKETPYGIPYRPHIWGAGWGIQRQAFEYYFLHSAYPETFGPDPLFNALNFVLGCHPGSNNMSFASGIGTKSALVAYGWNRADWSFVPGGVISGTALIRPDFPELLDFPYLWQQTEYVLGGGSSHYMFMVLAAIGVLNGSPS